MMLFLLHESYFYILGILLTFDLFVPEDILGEVLCLISSNDYKQYTVNIYKHIRNPFLSQGIMVVFKINHMTLQ